MGTGIPIPTGLGADLMEDINHKFGSRLPLLSTRLPSQL